MSDSKYIGRGEVLAKKILLKLVNCVGIQQQVNIKDIVNEEDYAFLSQEIRNHKFDLVVRRSNAPDIVVEINYRHKEKAAFKWRKIFIPMIVIADCYYVAINDWDCRPKGLFWVNNFKKHIEITWNDIRDVIDALETAGINPDIQIE